MKKLLTGTLLFFALSSNAQTTVYHEFPDSNAVWNFVYDNFCMAFPVGGYDHIDYSITITGDTLIGGQGYKKLFTPFLQVSISSGCGVPIDDGYQGAFREDVGAKQVYYVAPGNNTEELLYDFNLEVGDTVLGVMYPFTGSQDTVISVDSILIGSDYRKMWYINDWYNIRIIEGIGSIYGLIQQSPGYATDFPNFTLTCFNQDSNTLYPSGPPGPCNLITGFSNPQPETFKVTPNPAGERFTVELPDDGFKDICLIDVSGRTVREFNLSDLYMEVTDVPAGWYLLKVSDGTSRVLHAPLMIVR